MTAIRGGGGSGGRDATKSSFGSSSRLTIGMTGRNPNGTQQQQQPQQQQQTAARVTLDTSALHSEDAVDENGQGENRHSNGGQVGRVKAAGLLKKLLPTREKVMRLFSVAPNMRSANVQIKSRSSVAHSRRLSVDEDDENDRAEARRRSGEQRGKEESESSDEEQDDDGTEEDDEENEEEDVNENVEEEEEKVVAAVEPLKSREELVAIREEIVGYVTAAEMGHSSGEEAKSEGKLCVEEREERVTHALRELADVIVWTDRHDAVHWTAWRVLDGGYSGEQTESSNNNGAGAGVENTHDPTGNSASEVENDGDDGHVDEWNQIMPLIARCAAVGSREVRMQVFQTLSIVVQSVRARKSLELVYHSRVVMNVIISSHHPRRRQIQQHRLQSVYSSNQASARSRSQGERASVTNGEISTVALQNGVNTELADEFVMHDADGEGQQNENEDEDGVMMFLSLLRTISQRLDAVMLETYFFDSQLRSLPLYTEALRYFAHEDGIIRTAVRGITLSVYSIKQQACLLDLVTAASDDSRHYFRQLAKYLTGLVKTLRALIARVALPRAHDLALKPNDLLRFDDFKCELENTLEYVVEIMALSNDRLGPCLTGVLLEDFFRPLLKPLVQLAAAAHKNARRRRNGRQRRDAQGHEVGGDESAGDNGEGGGDGSGSKREGEAGGEGANGIELKRFHSAACAASLVVSAALRAAASDRLLSSVLALELLMPASGSVRVTPCEGFKVLAATCEDERVLCIVIDAVTCVVQQKILSSDDMYSQGLMMPPPPPPPTTTTASPPAVQLKPTVAMAAAAATAGAAAAVTTTAAALSSVDGKASGGDGVETKASEGVGESARESGVSNAVGGEAASAPPRDRFRMAASPFPSWLKRGTGTKPSSKTAAASGKEEAMVEGKSEGGGGDDDDMGSRAATAVSGASIDEGASGFYEFDPLDLLWFGSPSVTTKTSVSDERERENGGVSGGDGGLKGERKQYEDNSKRGIAASAIDALSIEPPIATCRVVKPSPSAKRTSAANPEQSPAPSACTSRGGSTAVREFARAPSKALQDAPLEELLYTLFSYEHHLKSARLFVSAGALLVAMAIKCADVYFYTAVASNILRDVSKRVSQELFGREHVTDSLIHAVFNAYREALFNHALCFVPDLHSSTATAAGTSWLRSHQSECYSHLPPGRAAASQAAFPPSASPSLPRPRILCGLEPEPQVSSATAAAATPSSSTVAEGAASSSSSSSGAGKDSNPRGDQSSTSASKMVESDGGGVEEDMKERVSVGFGGRDFDIYDGWAMIVMVRTIDVLRRLMRKEQRSIGVEEELDDDGVGEEVGSYASMSMRALQASFRNQDVSVELKEKALLNLFALTNSFRGDESY